MVERDPQHELQIYCEALFRARDEPHKHSKQNFGRMLLLFSENQFSHFFFLFFFCFIRSVASSIIKCIMSLRNVLNNIELREEKKKKPILKHCIAPCTYWHKESSFVFRLLYYDFTLGYFSDFTCLKFLEMPRFGENKQHECRVGQFGWRTNCFFQ